MTCQLHDIPRLLSENIIRNNIVHCPCFDDYSSLLLRCLQPQIKAARENVNNDEELERSSLVPTFKRSRCGGDGAIKNATVCENRCPQPVAEGFTTTVSGGLFYSPRRLMAHFVRSTNYST